MLTTNHQLALPEHELSKSEKNREVTPQETSAGTIEMALSQILAHIAKTHDLDQIATIFIHHINTNSDGYLLFCHFNIPLSGSSQTTARRVYQTMNEVNVSFELYKLLKEFLIDVGYKRPFLDITLPELIRLGLSVRRLLQSRSVGNQVLLELYDWAQADGIYLL